MSNIGRIIRGFCDGYFGRDSYGDKRIEAEGYDWIVARPVDEEPAYPTFTHFGSPERKQRLIDEWAGESEPK